MKFIEQTGQGDKERVGYDVLATVGGSVGSMPTYDHDMSRSGYTAVHRLVDMADQLAIAGNRIEQHNTAQHKLTQRKKECKQYEA
jgi:hypothetical protein